MKNFSLNATEENVFETLRSNAIGRNDSVFQFVDVLSNIQDESCVIAINGNWGSGKTFFVKQVKLVLDALNPFTEMDEDTRAHIIEMAQNRELTGCESFATVYFDSWMYDNNDDPILSLVYAVIADHQQAFFLEETGRLKAAAKTVVDTLACIKDEGKILQILQRVLNAEGTKDILEPIKTGENLKKEVHEFISSLIQEHGNRLVIFVDELDRCKPDYAIRFLERIKHYFDDDRITFVFSVSLSQLQGTIKKYYGETFDATRYLDKFFDLRMSLPGVDKSRFLLERLHISTVDGIGKVMLEVVNHFNLSLRETERYARLAKIALIPAVEKCSSAYTYFSLMYFGPIILALQMTDTKAYTDFMDGSDAGPILEILLNERVYIDASIMQKRMEDYNFTKGFIENGDGKETVTTIEDRLLEIYHLVFSKLDENQFRESRNTGFVFSPKTRRAVEEVMALLSPFNNYQFD